MSNKEISSNSDSNESESESINSLNESNSRVNNNNNNINNNKNDDKNKKRKRIKGNNSLLLSYSNLSNEQFLKKGLELFRNPKRDFNENQIVIEFLMNLEPFAQSIKEVKKENSRDLFSSLSFTLKHKFLEKNRIIYKFSDDIDNFYLILNGKVNVLVPNEEYIKLAEPEYFIYLLNLRQYNEIVLLQRILNKNNNIYPMNEQNFDSWIKRAVVTIQNYHMKLSQKDKFIGKRISLIQRQSISKDEINYNINQNYYKNNNNEKKRDSIIKTMTFQPRKSLVPKKLIGIKPFENDDEKTLVLYIQDQIMETYKTIENPLIPKTFFEFENRNEKISVEHYINRIKPTINYDEDLKYNYERRDVLIATYFLAQELKTGEKFGEELSDLLYLNEDQRVETVITTEDTDLAYFSRTIYNDVLKETSEKSKRDKINFLMGLNILKTNTNLRNFSNYFKQKICRAKQILYLENAPYENNHFVYFIQNGEFDTKAHKSLFEIDNILLNSHFKNKLNKAEIDELGNKKEYYEKKILKFESFGKNDIIGLSDCIYNNHYLFTVSCQTNNAIVYEININFFKMLLNISPIIKERLVKMQQEKNEIILNSLYKQRLSGIELIYQKYQNKNINERSYSNIKSENNTIENLKYSEKKLKYRLQSPISIYQKKSIKTKQFPILNESNIIIKRIQSKTKKNLKSIYFSNDNTRFKFKRTYDIDLILRDNETTNTSRHKNTFSLNTFGNFNDMKKTNENFQKKKRKIKLFKKTNNLYIDSIKKKVIENNKVVQLRNFSQEKKISFKTNNNNNKINNNNLLSYDKVFTSQNQSFINPLLYDDFDRKYNAFRYFKPKKEDLREPYYRLEINSSIINYKKQFRTGNNSNNKY